MKIVKIPVSKIKNWETFHTVFAETLGFPDFYGANMNAWVDCLQSIDEPDDGMTSIHVEKGEMLVLDFGECTAFAARCPEQYEAILDSSAFVNYSRLETGDAPVLSLSFWNKVPIIKARPNTRVNTD
jgi:hypothetical protein